MQSNLFSLSLYLIRYESLRYGVENSARGLEIKDPETGELLGGKRAAIQYAYSVKYGPKAGTGTGDKGGVNKGREAKLP